MKLDPTSILLKMTLIVTLLAQGTACSNANFLGGGVAKKRTPGTGSESNAQSNQVPRDPRLVDIVSEKFPVANVVLLIDNSESMKASQSYVASGLSKLVDGLVGKINVRVMTTSQLWFQINSGGDSSSGLDLRNGFVTHPPIGAPSTVTRRTFISEIKKEVFSPQRNSEGKRIPWNSSMISQGLAPVEVYTPQIGFIPIEGTSTMIELDASLPAAENGRRLSLLRDAITNLGVDGGKDEAPLCAIRQIAANYAATFDNGAPTAIVVVTDEDDMISAKEKNEFFCPESYEVEFNRKGQTIWSLEAGRLSFNMLKTHQVKQDDGSLVDVDTSIEQPAPDSRLLPAEGVVVTTPCTEAERDKLHADLIGRAKANSGYANLVIEEDIVEFRKKGLAGCTVTDQRGRVNIIVNKANATCSESNVTIDHPYISATTVFTNVDAVIDAFMAHSHIGDKRRWESCTQGASFDGTAETVTMRNYFGRFQYRGNPALGNLDRNQETILAETATALKQAMNTKPILVGLLNRGAANPAGCPANPASESTELEKFIKMFDGDIASVCDSSKYGEVLGRLKDKVTSIVVRTYLLPEIVAQAFEVQVILNSGEQLTLSKDEDFTVTTESDGTRKLNLISTKDISEYKQLRFIDK
jgi:hypothetical protein